MLQRLSLLLFGVISSAYCQPNFESLQGVIYPINSINPVDTNYTDLQHLKGLLKDKEVVLLGEQEHGDGAALSAKIRIIKFLQKEMGFNVLVFESGFYKSITSWEDYKAHRIDFHTFLKSSIGYKHWVKPSEMLPLFDAIETGNLTLAGMDLPYTLNAHDKKKYRSTIDSLEVITGAKSNIHFNAALNKLFEEGIKSNPSTDERVAFAQHIDSLLVALTNFRNNDFLQFWKQELSGLRSMGFGWWQENAHSRKNWWSSQNIRDNQMAENLLWLLATKFKGEKIVVWAANYHISRFVNTEISEDKYFQNSNAIPMGEVLHGGLGARMFSIGIVSYAGARTAVDNNFTIAPIKSRSAESFERFLHDKGYKFCYVDFSKPLKMQKFKLSGLFHYALQGRWNYVFDGLFYIDEMTPLTIK